MEKFELHLKEFCKLTIEKVDLNQQSYEFIKQQNYAEAAYLVPKKKIISEQLLILIKEIETEIKKTTLTTENFHNIKIVYSFLNQFFLINHQLQLLTDSRIFDIRSEINIKLKNHDFKNIDNLKLELIGLQKNRYNNNNWWNY